MNLEATESVTANPFVFVVGCPRSGTTLLQRMLDNHPDLAVANDTHFITRAAKKSLRKHSNPPLTDELVQDVSSYRRFHRMGLDDGDINAAATGCKDYSHFVSRLYTLRGAKFGKSLSGEKTPDYCRQIPALNRLFPAAKFVHIIRDGRDTAMSAINWANKSKGPGKWKMWTEDPVGCSALWWRWQVGAGMREGRKLSGRLYHEVKYEKLVADAPKLLRAAAEFLQIPYSDNMGNYFKGKTRNNPKLSAKSAWLPPTSGLRNWRIQMKREDIAVFEAVAGELLEQLGYELSREAMSQTAATRVKQCLAWWKDQPM